MLSPHAGRRRLLAAAASAALGAPAAAQAQVQVQIQVQAPVQPARTLLVVASNGSRAVSLGRAELANLYLRTRSTLADGLPLRVLDAEDAALREAFYLALTGRDARQMHAYWARIVFNGAGRPPPRLTVAALFEAVRAEPDTVGYVSAADLPNAAARGLRVLLTLPMPEVER